MIPAADRLRRYVARPTDSFGKLGLQRLYGVSSGVTNVVGTGTDVQIQGMELSGGSRAAVSLVRRRSACVFQFLPDYSTQGGSQRLVCAPDVLPKSVIDQALIVNATRGLDLLAKPIQNIIVKPDGDPAFAPRNRYHSSIGSILWT